MVGGGVGGTEYQVAVDEDTEAALRTFLLKYPNDEEIAFATWYPSAGRRRFTALIHTPILPRMGDRRRHGNVSALPRYVDRAKETAREAGAGLAMIHTHPLGEGWQGPSAPDLYYEMKVLAQEAFGVTGLPLVGLILAEDGGWSARIYLKEPGKRPVRVECEAVRIVGRTLEIQFNPALRPAPEPGIKLLRTTSVWGSNKQARIMRMRVGVVGAGSVGSVIIESLARLGVRDIYVLDYDKVSPHNLDRLIYATSADVGKPKAELARTHAETSATNADFLCQAFPEASVVEDDGYALAKDCDVVFSCSDRPWPRQALNHLAYSALIPVVDGGVSFKVDDSRLIHGMFRAQTVGPGRACLNCLRAYDSAEVQLDREGKFDDPAYIEGLERVGAAPSRQNILPFALGLGALESIQFVELVTNLAGRGDLGQQPYDYATGEILPNLRGCGPGCEYKEMVARGDSTKPYLSTDISKQRSLNAGVPIGRASPSRSP
jgi:molybdopterin/thiamine biosynthesis adenylyltransferase